MTTFTHDQNRKLIKGSRLGPIEYPVNSNNIELFLSEVSNKDDLKKKLFRKSDTLDRIVNELKAEFRVSQDEHIRIWVRSSLDWSLISSYDFTIFEKTLEELVILNGQHIIIEVKNEDGTWPRDVGYHKRGDLQQYSPTERSKIQELFQEEENLHIKASNKKDELVMLLQRMTLIEADIKKTIIPTDNSLSHKISHIERKRQKLSQLREIDPESKKNEDEPFVDFLTKSIREKEETLTCPVCLETASAPLFTCHQMHLVCGGCRPRLVTCPECRAGYSGNTRHRWAEREAEHLQRLKQELSVLTGE